MPIPTPAPTPAPWPHLSPLVRAIPRNPLRALYPHAARPGMLNLASGHPSADAYDREGLAEASRRAAGDASAWSYGPGAGDPQLLDALAPLGPALPEGHRLLVTSGAQQAVDLALRCLAAPGRAVAVPEPVYPAILSVCAAAGLRAVGYDLAGDPDLAALGALLAGGEVAALYAQPTFSNPGGETLGLGARRRLLELCAAHGVPVVEDDPYRALAFGAPPPEALVTLSAAIPGSQVVWAGSLSKILAPGLRLGWAAVPERLAGPMTELRQAGDLQPNALAQRVAAHYLGLGRLEAHLARIRGLYRARGLRLAAALRGAGFVLDDAAGGMFLFPALPPGFAGGLSDRAARGLSDHAAAGRSERAAAGRSGHAVAGLSDHAAAPPSDRAVATLFDRAVARGVLYAPGAAFALSPGRFADRIRLCFAGLGEAALAEGAARLVAALEG